MTRQDKARDLSWTRLPLEALSDAQLDDLHQYVEAELELRRSCHVHGACFVRKERRLGNTNRFGWRWVAYVGETHGAALEVAVCSTQHAARLLGSQHHAVYFAEFARSQRAAQIEAFVGILDPSVARQAGEP